MLSSFRLYIRAVVRFIFVIVNNCYCIPTHAVWLIMLLPFRKLWPDLFWRIEGYSFHWLLSMVTLWSWSAGYDIVEMGDDVKHCYEEESLVLVNHQSTADVPFLMAAFNNKKGVTPNIMWIMDKIFKYTNFGIVSYIHEDFFIISGPDKRESSLRDLKRHLQNIYIPLQRKWLVLFPEGGFLRKRREASQRYALKNNFPVLEHVTLPRIGAMQVIMNTLCTKPDEEESNNISEGTSHKAILKWIIDITVAYPGGNPIDLQSICSGYRLPCETIFFYRIYPACEVPTKQDGLTKWLYDRYVEKEDMLGSYYKTGKFPVNKYCKSPMKPRKISHDPFRFLILHLFFIASTYFHCRLLTWLWSFFLVGLDFFIYLFLKWL